MFNRCWRESKALSHQEQLASRLMKLGEQLNTPDVSQKLPMHLLSALAKQITANVEAEIKRFEADADADVDEYLNSDSDTEFPVQFVSKL